LALTLAVVVPVMLAPVVSPGDPLAVSLGDRFLPPLSPGHPFGTDDLGRDLLARLAWGGRVSLIAGVLAVLLAGGVGSLLGLAAGLRGGAVDAAVSRLVEAQLSLPLLMLLLLVIAVFGQNLAVLVLVLAIAQWPESARLTRALALVEREQTYVEAARSVGAGPWRILARHLLPNVAAPLLVVLTLLLAQAVLVESALSYLGLGVARPYPTWGRVLADGQQYITTAWWLVTIPGLVISVLVLGVNLLAEGVREVVTRGTG
jgi:peptide/nickel transport system permease protein